MAAPTNANPTLSLNFPCFDPAGDLVNVALRVGNVTTDTSTGIIYGDLIVGNSSTSPIPTLLGAAQTTPITAGKSTDTVIKNSAGTFFGILITTVGAGAPLVYDNASTSSGTIVGASIVSAPLGFILGPPIGVQCLNGITVKGGVTMPAMTILWS